MIKNDQEVMINVDNVSKNFKLPHQKRETIKHYFTNMLSLGNKTFETQHALKNITFNVKKGEFLGVVGRNGSGKSTLLKILAGIYQPSSGNLQVKGRLVPFIELGVGFNPELTGRQNVYLNGALLGFSNKEVSLMYDEIVKFAELEKFMDQKLKNYSSGMQVRLAFSMAIRGEADILLIDEVLAVGDADFQRKCFDYFKKLKKSKITVILVTHDMSAVREFCDRAILINNNKITAMGNPSKVSDMYSDMFMTSDEKSITSSPSTRRGTRTLSYMKPSVIVTSDSINIKVKIKAHEDAKQVLYGIHIFSADGQELTGVNNRTIRKNDITNVKKGDIINVSWTVQNIFNDGLFTITLSLADPVNITYDWFEEAASFRVKRRERSITPIIPPIDVITSQDER